MVTETLKLLLRGLDLARAVDSTLQAGVMRLLIDLLVLCSRPRERDLLVSLKALVTQTMTMLATGKHSAVFRSVLVSLPPGSRQKLQVNDACPLILTDRTKDAEQQVAMYSYMIV